MAVAWTKRIATCWLEQFDLNSIKVIFDTVFFPSVDKERVTVTQTKNVMER